MKGFIFRPKHLTILICWLALAGCLGGPSGPTSFYMLSALSSSPAGTSAANERSEDVACVSSCTEPAGSEGWSARSSASRGRTSS